MGVAIYINSYYIERPVCVSTQVSNYKRVESYKYIYSLRS